MLNLQKAVITLLLLHSFNLIHAQMQAPAPALLGQVNISSPNSAALGKYVDIPVNYHTGIPTIGIPIYTVQSGNLSLPISMSYHASGLKVQEQASWVGAGWSLNAGGMITRSVIGLPDEKLTNNGKNQKGYLSDEGVLSYYNSYTNDDIINGRTDAEPDLFTFNFAGQSGKFYIRDDKTPMLVPEQDIKIEFTYEPGVTDYSPYYSSYGYAKSIQAFKITTKDGTKYYFGIFQNKPEDGCVNPVEISQAYLFYNGGGPADNRLITGWYLYKIESADGTNNIYLDYKKDTYATIQPVASTNYNTISKNLFTSVKLAAIRFANGKIEFQDGIDREDLVSWNGVSEITGVDPATGPRSKSLGKIKISDNNGNCKIYNFYYSFFVDNTTQLPAQMNTAGSTLISDKKKLKLDSLNEESCTGGTRIPAYRFSYFTEPVVRSVSYNMDHWGFMNGVTTNNDLYPPLTLNGQPYYPEGNNIISNREPNWPAMRGGTLSSIKYPTGGETSYEYEANTVKVNTQNVIVGGLRIKKITQKDGTITNPDIVTNFTYTNSDGFSSGVLYSRPTYIQISRNDIFEFFKISQASCIGGGNQGCSACGINPYTTLPLVTNRYSLVPLKTVQGNHIAYENVKVSKQNNGVSMYKYYVTESFKNISSIAITNVSYTGTTSDCLQSIPNYPAAPLKNDFLSGELKHEVHLTEQGSTIKEKLYTPSFKESKIKIYGVKAVTNGGGIMSTLYEIKTGSKLKDIIIENDYTSTPSSPLTTTTTINYNSDNHSEPTSIVKQNSKGEIVETKIKYIKDFIAPTIVTMQTDVSEYNVFEQKYQRFTTDPNNLDYSLYQAVENCVGQSNVAICRAGLYFSDYISQVVNTRKAWIAKRKTQYLNTNPLNVYQSLHNTAKSSAVNDWKAILWMQDVGINAPVEFTNWKSGNLLSANYTSFKNYNNNDYTNYPFKQYQIKLNTLSTVFTNSSIGSNDIQKDSRYQEEIEVSYFNGNINNAKQYQNITTSYQWGYNNSFPVAKAINAKGIFKNQVNSQTNLSTDVVIRYAGSTAGSGNQDPLYFFQNTTGEIKISLPNTCLPPGANLILSYTITTPSNSTISNSFNINSTSNCSTPLIHTYPNMPIGQYVFQVSASTSFNSYTFSKEIHVTYNKLLLENLIVADAGTEFFAENFEQELNYTTGNAHTGRKYSAANYTVTFAPPNSRQYIIQWYSLQNNVWVLNEQNFTAGMVLTGPVDDIRVFPSDAQITTYSYSPLYGISAEIDTRGRTTYYSYDAVGRLTLVRDNNGNVIRKICYSYAGQPEQCQIVSPSWQNTGNIRCKPCPANIIYTSNILQNEQKDMNPYSLTYNQVQWVDAGTTTNCGTAVFQNQGAPYCETNNGENTGNQLQLQKDVNPCSITYNQYQTILLGYNPSACPLPSTCNASNCYAEGYKCVYGVCELGYRVNTDSYYDWLSGMVICVYHYEWSDGTWSGNYEEYGYGYCPIQ